LHRSAARALGCLSRGHPTNSFDDGTATRIVEVAQAELDGILAAAKLHAEIDVPEAQKASSPTPTA
jgi:hypothetical protein